MNYKKMAKSFIQIFDVLLLTIEAVVYGACGPGHYLDKTTQECKGCGPKTFMPQSNHPNLSCWPCESDPLPGSNKEVIRPCTSKSDTEIGCKSYAYRRKRTLSNFYCTSCTICEDGEEETASCTEYHNRECSTVIQKDISIEIERNCTTVLPPIIIDDHAMNATHIPNVSHHSDNTFLKWCLPLVLVVLLEIVLILLILKSIFFLLAKYYPEQHEKYSNIVIKFITGRPNHSDTNPASFTSYNTRSTTAVAESTDTGFCGQSQNLLSSSSNTNAHMSQSKESVTIIGVDDIAN